MNRSLNKIKVVCAISLLAITGFGQSVKIITVTNPSAIERTDELVVMSRDLLQKKLGAFSFDKFITVTKGNQPVVVQFDDMDRTGKWDEASFLYTFKPNETVMFDLKVSDRPSTVKAVVRAHVRQMHKMPDESFGPSVLLDTMPYNNQPTDFSKKKLPPYLTEGPGWENDKVGFRKYFDTRNSNDLWGKVTNKMVLDEVGVNPSIIYHDFNPAWGMDILKVGKSLGAGGLALSLNIDGKDSLIRFGTNVAQTTYEQLADGPIRAIFRIRYKGWKIASLPPIDVTEEISIWGGQYFYENKVTITSAPAGTKLVTGTIDFFTDHYDILSNGDAKGLYTFGQQSENKDNLGLGILVFASSFYNFGHTFQTGNGVLNTYTVAMDCPNNKPDVYRYYVGWERTNDQFRTKDGFGKFMEKEVIKMKDKLLVY